jgi:hypothetical protein
MAETTQISATISEDLEIKIDQQPERKMISFSKMVEVLLMEAVEIREKSKKQKK